MRQRTQQIDIQEFIDSMTPVERHMVVWLMNEPVFEYSPLFGDTIQDRLDYLREQLDDARRVLNHENRAYRLMGE